jgi:hypothetical protein
MSKEEKTDTVTSGKIMEGIYEGWFDPLIELPKEMVVVLVALEGSVALGYVENGEWNLSHFPGEGNWDMEIYHWLPLPHPLVNYQLIPPI